MATVENCQCFFSPFLLDQQDFLVTSLPVSCLEGKGFMGNKHMRVRWAFSIKHLFYVCGYYIFLFSIEQSCLHLLAWLPGKIFQLKTSPLAVLGKKPSPGGVEWVRESRELIVFQATFHRSSFTPSPRDTWWPVLMLFGGFSGFKMRVSVFPTAGFPSAVLGLLSCHLSMCFPAFTVLSPLLLALPILPFLEFLYL